MSKVSTRELVSSMSDFVNSYLPDTNEFVDMMSREHRTLQQSFTRLCVAWLERLAREERYDLRNEASVMLGREFVSRVESRFRSLPYI